MKEMLRKLYNRNSYSVKTQQLLKLRKETLSSKGIFRIIKLHKYNSLLHFFSADIPIETEIGEGLVLPHGGNGIFISRGAKIGKNCVIFQQVTIGSNTLNDTKKPGAPIIGNNVYIGAGAKIIGGITVGNNVRIGANAVVVENVPDNSTVVMDKPKMITKRWNDNNFACYKNG